MDRVPSEKIAAIHASGARMAVVVTGGAVRFVAWLFSLPGASRSVVEVQIPYAEEALRDYLGVCPAHYCSRETAEAMARRARQRALWLGATGRVLGVAATASLVTDRPKRGPHRCHAACWDGTRMLWATVTLAKGRRSRPEEDEVASLVALYVLTKALGIEPPAVELLPEDRLEEDVQQRLSPLHRLLSRACARVTQSPDGAWRQDHGMPKAILPGSFNPLHDGHRRLAEVAERILACRVHFELSITNVDKPPLDEAEVLRRARQFEWYRPLELTDAPLFAQKADLFPGVTFVVGADTAERILHPRYYPDGSTGVLRALTHLAAQRCRFLVAARRAADGRLVQLSDLPVPSPFANLFQPIPVSEFQYDISSTSLRQMPRVRVL